MPWTIAITHRHICLSCLPQFGFVAEIFGRYPWYPRTSSTLTSRTGIDDENKMWIVYTLVHRCLSRHKLLCCLDSRELDSPRDRTNVDAPLCHARDAQSSIDPAALAPSILARRMEGVPPCRSGFCYSDTLSIRTPRPRSESSRFS
jgi:hypothetical protein